MASIIMAVGTVLTYGLSIVNNRGGVEICRPVTYQEASFDLEVEAAVT
jgi:hypothetical protein